MSLLVTGSIGIDTVEAPSGKAVDALGGSSIYFAQAASFFGPVRLVGVVGEDCPDGFLAPLEGNSNVDLGGLEVRAGSKTFRWHGRYHDDVNQRDTIAVDLNVLGEDGPKIPAGFRDSEYVFLANTHPFLQMELLNQLDAPKFVVADTMDLWIDQERDGLMGLLMGIDGVVLNDAEAIQLTGMHNVVAAGMEILDAVKSFCIVKKGEHGSLLFTGEGVYPQPAWPARTVVDPTGAGDSFAGGMMGYLSEKGADSEAEDFAETLRRAIAYGSVVASFTLEDFSLKGLLNLSREDIDGRFEEFLSITRF